MSESSAFDETIDSLNDEFIIRQPKIFIISRPNFQRDYYEFLSYMNLDWRETSIDSAPPAQRLVEFAGRICYLSYYNTSKRNNSKYVRNIIAKGHESVIEHLNWSFVLCGVSRAFTHQLVRHRVGFSFSQLSQQYHDESRARFVEPKAISRSPAARNIWKESMKSLREAYMTILDLLDKQEIHNGNYSSKKERLRKIRSSARSVLPNATESAIVVTANARALRNFFKQRGSIEGDEEMRCVCVLILEEIKKDAPDVFYDFEVSQISDGSLAVKWTSDDTSKVTSPS